MSMLKDVLDGKWNDIKQNVEKQVADKIWDRVQDKKVDVLSNLNRISRDDMLERLVSKDAV